MFRYKDLRMLVVSVLITLLCVAAMIYFIHEKIKFLIVIFLFITTLPTMLFRYNAKVFHDSVMVYVFKGIAILPELINFTDIKDITFISKHRVIIQHKKVSRLYLVNAKEFYDELNEKYQQFINTDQ
ncbi:hypothetical protein H6A03_10645 [[Clostridium] spiroforme]|nr:hypothetical protein [Thomasclavelia spiroformis]MBM6881035.1 hypothetical protein [Thomasclavelia spiroformis]